MFSSVFFVCLVTFSSLFEPSLESPTRIEERPVGGYPDKVPYTVAIIKDGKLICSGSIIDQSWIVTAAHCILSMTAHLTPDGGPVDDGVSVLVGTNNLTDWKNHSLPIKRAIFHQLYSGCSTNHDIGLVELAKPLSESANGPYEIIALPEKNSQPDAGELAKATGFGLTDSDDPNPELLHSVDTFIKSARVCRLDWPDYDETLQMCAGREGTRVCVRESGGPLAIKIGYKPVLVGLLSSRSSYSCGEFADFFTRVSVHLPWIQHFIAED